MKRPLQLVVPFLVGTLLGAGSISTARAQVATDELEVVLAIDTSGSMRHVIESAKASAKQFVVAMPAEVRIGVETFGDDVTVLAPPTLDRTLLAEQIDGIVAAGDTALYDAVVTAGMQFTPAAERRVLVLLSDGKDDGSTATLEDALAAVQDEHVEAISLTTPETDLASLLALGTVTSADDAAGVSAAFARVVDLLAEVVAPTPPPPPTTAPPTTAAPPTTSAPSVAPTTVPAPAAAAPITTTPAPAVTRPGATTTGSPAPVTAASPARASRTALWVGASGIFGALFALGMLLVPRRRVSKARLGIRQPRRVSDMGQRTMSAVDQALERHGRRAELASALSVADISVSPGDFVARVGIVAVVVGFVGLFLGGPIVAALLALGVCLAVWSHVRRTTGKRRAAFADQLPDVLQLVTTALRSGYGITQALESVAEEAEEPARGEFGHILVESRLGRDLSDAMRALALRMGSKDLEWVVSAIDINRETGGNLSEILGTVSGTIRERQRLARHVRTLTAEGRLSARILTGLPFLMALWQWRTSPDDFALLTYGIGLTAAITAGVLMVLGTIWVRRIVNSIAL